MKIWKSTSGALLAGAFMLAGGLAQASAQPDVAVPPGAIRGGTASPGGTAITSFTISFTGNYEFIGMDTTVSYNPDLLTFNPLQSSVSILGQSYSLPEFFDQLSALSSIPGSDFTAVGGESMLGVLFFGAGFAVTGSTTLTGEIVVNTAFDLSSTFAVGTSSQVKVEQLEFADVNITFTPLASPEFPLVMTVTAVPEPESWLMLLAGLGLLGAVAKRRSARA